MRNQIEMAERAGVEAATVNSTNRERWDEIADRADAGFATLLEGDTEVVLDLLERDGSADHGAVLAVELAHALLEGGELGEPVADGGDPDLVEAPGRLALYLQQLADASGGRGQLYVDQREEL